MFLAYPATCSQHPILTYQPLHLMPTNLVTNTTATPERHVSLVHPTACYSQHPILSYQPLHLTPNNLVAESTCVSTRIPRPPFI